MIKRFFHAVILCLVAAMALPAFAATQIPYEQTAVAPGAIVVNGTCYIFYVRAGQPGGYLFYQTNSGSGWSTPRSVPQASYILINTGTVPRAAFFNNRIYVFYEASTGGVINYWSIDLNGNGDGTAGTVPGATTNSSPGVSAFNGRLYAAWRATASNTSIFYSSMDVNGNWTSTAHLSTGESDRGPSLASFVAADGVEYLYAVWKDIGTGPGIMWYSYMSPSSGGWTTVQHLDTGDYPMTAAEPSITPTDTGMAVIYTGGYNPGFYYKSMNGYRAWSNEVDVDPNLTAGATAGGFFYGQLHGFYLQNSFLYDQVMY